MASSGGFLSIVFSFIDQVVIQEYKSVIVLSGYGRVRTETQ